jgi:hypothetical protein
VEGVNCGKGGGSARSRKSENQCLAKGQRTASPSHFQVAKVAYITPQWSHSIFPTNAQERFMLQIIRGMSGSSHTVSMTSMSRSAQQPFDL